MTDPLATPSIRVTRIHGKNTYIEKFTGAIRADYREENYGLDKGRLVPQELCPCCHGCGQTPLNMALSEAEAKAASYGQQICDEDGGALKMLTCAECNGDGTVDSEDDDPCNYEPDNFDEYRFQDR